ncbi:MAG: NUDIX domain-containing protein [Nanoarchaeota archaeon]
MKKKLTEKEFKFIYTKVPRICVELIILKRKKILLTKRSINPFKDFWHFPGGGVLYKEKIKETINRVSKEELGIKVVPQKFLGYAEYLNDGFRHSVSLSFKCKIMGNQQPRALEQADEIKFFKKIPEQIVPAHRKFLKTHLKNF